MSRPTFSWGGLFFSIVVFLVILFIFGGSSEYAQAAAGRDCPLISSMQAARHGMERQWHTQVPLDSSNNRVTHLTLIPKSETSPDTLFVQTERATVFAIDAETGKTLWAKVVGRPDLVSEPVGCNDQMVAVLNGSKLFIINRISGRTMWTRDFPGVPAAGPVLSSRYAYVPLLDGCVNAYPIRKIERPDEKKSWASGMGAGEVIEVSQTVSEKISNANTLTLSQKKVEPLVCPSLYRIETQPVLVQDDPEMERLAWINRCGMYVGTISPMGATGFQVDYALDTSLTYEASPAFVPSRFMDPDQESDADAADPFGESSSAKKNPMLGALLAASSDGQVSAVKAGNGGTLWGYHVGQPVVQPIVAIGTRVYVVTQLGQMFCLDARTGKRIWQTQDVSQFISQTSNRIYVRDGSGAKISTLRLADGRRIDRCPISGFTHVVRNDKTDRVFLVSETGLVQSLRQRGVEEPIRHRE